MSRGASARLFVAVELPVRVCEELSDWARRVAADARSRGEGTQERITSPGVRAIMQRLAVLMKPVGMTTTNVPALSLLELVPQSAAVEDAAAVQDIEGGHPHG